MNRNSRAKLPRVARLRLGYQYDAVRKNGMSVYGSLFRLSVLAQETEKEQTQCGIIVSRRVGNAVVRNVVKRRLRELYRKERQRLAPSLWLVMIATSKAATASLVELQAEWLRLGQKLSVFSTH